MVRTKTRSVSMSSLQSCTFASSTSRTVWEIVLHPDPAAIGYALLTFGAALILFSEVVRFNLKTILSGAVHVRRTNLQVRLNERWPLLSLSLRISASVMRTSRVVSHAHRTVNRRAGNTYYTVVLLSRACHSVKVHL